MEWNGMGNIGQSDEGETQFQNDNLDGENSLDGTCLLIH
jgi:hypothetical protein